jgi:hypothetical protein
MQKIQELQKEMQNLRNALTSENYEETVKKMQAIDKQITAARTADLLKNVNNKQARLREFAKQAFECEQPSEDVTTNGGYFHKTKVKKYPKLSSLQYASAKWEDNKITRLTINGEKFTMYRTEYKHNEPTKYTRPETFADFLQLNHISPEDITAEQFTEIAGKIKEANEEMQKHIEAYSKKMDSLNSYSLECWNLIHKKAEHVYLYHTNQ